MPSVSERQHKFMEAVAHNPAFAKRAGVPQAVGQEFADAGKAKPKPKKSRREVLYGSKP